MFIMNLILSFISYFFTPIPNLSPFFSKSCHLPLLVWCFLADHALLPGSKLPLSDLLVVWELAMHLKYTCRKSLLVSSDYCRVKAINETPENEANPY